MKSRLLSLERETAPKQQVDDSTWVPSFPPQAYVTPDPAMVDRARVQDMFDRAAHQIQKDDGANVALHLASGTATLQMLAPTIVEPESTGDQRPLSRHLRRFNPGFAVDPRTLPAVRRSAEGRRETVQELRVRMQAQFDHEDQLAADYVARATCRNSASTHPLLAATDPERAKKLFSSLPMDVLQNFSTVDEVAKYVE